MKSSRILLGIVSFFPVAYLIFFIGVAYGAALWDWRPGQVVVRVLVGGHLACMLLVFGLIAFYLYHVSKNTTLSAEQKISWIAAICFLNALSIPVYWYLYVLRLAARSSATEGPGCRNGDGVETG